jgi:hypothetical protein
MLGITNQANYADNFNGSFDPVKLLRSSSGNGGTGFLVSLFSEGAIITSFIGFVLGKKKMLL